MLFVTKKANSFIMKNFILFLLPILGIIMLTGCPESFHHYKYKDAYFPEKPQNITEVNSEFDDYNSVLPETHFGKRLLFSSNRTSHAENFDIYDGNFYVVWDWETGMLTFHNDYHYGYNDFVGKMVNRIETDGNQFAPYFVSFDSMINNHQNNLCFLMYSTNADSNIYRSEFMYYLTPNDGASGEVFGPFVIPFLGDEKQQYVSFYGNKIYLINSWEINADAFTTMYFDATTDEQSDIFKIDIPDSMSFMEFLSTDNNYQQTPVNVLNSEYNDRCPFVNGSFMVFASDRPGGYGGYDLYYSKFENGEWSEPVNFGEKVNTEYDEFRPITTCAGQFVNDLMIFSSNRPGGLGGFDLYFVGIEKIDPTLFAIE